MLVDGIPYRSIWDEDGRIMIIDQTLLPFRFEIRELKSWKETVTAIKEMWVRGAPLIGGAAAYGIYLAIKENGAQWPDEVEARLRASRPTAVNLAFAIDFMKTKLEKDFTSRLALESAREFCEAEAKSCRLIGLHGVSIIEEIYTKKQEPVNILTHCNAGWISCIDYGTATAPIYEAHSRGIPVHVWVDETRPRNQGSRLTAWELGQQGVPYSVISDNAGGHLMQRGQVDLLITGSDRTTLRGDVANKIGTYLKALAAKEHGTPFWIALPTSTIDMDLEDGISEIPIEERSENEVLSIDGWNGDKILSVKLAPAGSKAFNPGFDVTPAKLVSGIITEKGMCKADEASIRKLMSHG